MFDNCQFNLCLKFFCFRLGFAESSGRPSRVSQPDHDRGRPRTQKNWFEDDLDDFGSRLAKKDWQKKALSEAKKNLYQPDEVAQVRSSSYAKPLARFQCLITVALSLPFEIKAGEKSPDKPSWRPLITVFQQH